MKRVPLFHPSTTKPDVTSNQKHYNLREQPNKPHLLIILVTSLLISATFLLIATKSSPLYPINDWSDPNTFFTVGKGMINGAVPYRDLFEHKGPLLYFLHGLAYLISNSTFLGVYIVEVISFSLFLYFTFKIINLFVDWKYSAILLPIMAAAVLNLRSFAHGDTAEELTLPFMMISLYYLLRFYKNPTRDALPQSWVLINGIIAGCVLWIKYSFLGFWLGWIISITVCYLMNKQLIQSIKTSLWFLLGILIASVPWLFYFGINRAMPDWIHTYFTINLTMYPESLSAVEIIRSILLSFRKHLYLNPASVSLIFLGMFVFVTNKKYIHHALHRFSLLFSFLLLALGVYIGGKDYIYYFLIFSPFVVVGFIILADLYADTYGSIKSKTLLMGLILIIFIVTLAYTYRFNRNRYMLAWEKDDMVQYKFAAIMKETNHPTLLNYGFQDGGFYTIAGITPNVRFFQKYNFSYREFPLNMDEQNRYIKEGFVDYVVLRLGSSDELKSLDVPFLYDNYELTATEDQLFGETSFVYLLFKHK